MIIFNVLKHLKRIDLMIFLGLVYNNTFTLTQKQNFVFHYKEVIWINSLIYIYHLLI